MGRRRGESRAGKHTGNEQRFFVIHWEFSIDPVPDPRVSESLLLHNSAESVILAIYHRWKNVLPALECGSERLSSHPIHVPLWILFPLGSSAEGPRRAQSTLLVLQRWPELYFYICNGF